MISKQFGLKARIRQIDIMIDITRKKREVCIIVSINAGKNLVYQAILIFIRGFVLIISPTIAFIEDQIKVVFYYSFSIYC